VDEVVVFVLAAFEKSPDSMREEDRMDRVVSKVLLKANAADPDPELDEADWLPIPALEAAPDDRRPEEVNSEVAGLMGGSTTR
jgi:hypothetical protein